MSEGSITYEATFSLSYDPGIFFIPGIGASISTPNPASIFNIAGALSQAQSLLETAVSLVSSVSGGNLKFDAQSVVDFGVNAAVGEAQKLLKTGDALEIASAETLLSRFSPQSLASISAFNKIAASINSPQDLIGQVATLAGKSDGTLGSFAKSALSIGTQGLSKGLSKAGASDITDLGSSLLGNLGPQAASFVGGKLPSAETWANVFGSSFNPDLTPFLNLSLGQLIPPINQAIEINVGDQTYSKPVQVPPIDNYNLLGAFIP